MKGNTYMTILIVDDKIENTILLENMLGGIGYSVVTAPNGEIALQKLAETKIDLIISDILMPVMDGFLFCRKVKENADWSRIPFVFYTATYTDAKDEELAIKEGADRYLRKPMEPQEFIEAIQTVIRETVEEKIVGKKPEPALEEASLELYNSRLVKKLEKKMFDLENEIEMRRKTENALRTSEQRYRILFNAGNDAMFVHYLPGKNKKMTFLEVNDVACSRTGYSRDEFLKLTPDDLFTPDSVDVARKAMQKLESEKKIIFEAVRLTKEGEKIPVEISSTVFDLNGKDTVLSISRDLSERKQAEKALRESEERFRMLFNAGSDAIFVHQPTADRAPGRFIEVNEIACKMLEYSSDELLRLTPEDILPPDKLHSVQMIERLFEEKAVLFESMHVTKSGQKIPVEISAQLFEFQGKPTILSISRNIRARKEAEKEMNMLAHAIKSISECVSVTNVQDHLLFANDAFLKTYGYAWEEIAGKKSGIFRSARTPVEIQDQILPQTLAGGWQGEIWNTRKNGEEFEIHLSTSIIRDETGQPLALIGIASDISEQKKMERQFYEAQKMETVGMLAAGVAHDFNNLLTVINGYSVLIKTRLHSRDEVYEMAEDIQKAGERATALTSQLLAFSRKQVIQPEVLDLNSLVDGTKKMISRLIGEDIQLAVKLSKTMLPIKIDPGQMNQVLMNLVVNARDAMPNGGNLILETSAYEMDDSGHEIIEKGHYAQLSVTDNGIGMDPETQSHIFEPFFTTKRMGEGTGLGLATVYGIVKQNKGYILIDSEPRKGTRFNIYLPLMKRPDKDVERTGEKADLPRGNARILLVEDEAAVRELIRKVLSGYGYHIFSANLPEAAIKIFNAQQDKIDLVVTDVVMPQMNGKELFDQLSAKKPGLKALFISGYPASVVSQHGILEAGINFLQKPINISELVKVVHQILAK